MALSTSIPPVNARVNIVWISPSVCPGIPLRRFAELLLPAAVWAIFGCANPGPPRPPSLYLPSPVKDLRADRIGDQVHLAWTTSTETTDGIAAKLPLSAEICRDPVLPSPSPAACTVVQRLAVKPGPTSAIDPLPAALLGDPVRRLRYRVRLLNATAHAADPSNIAFAAAGAAPAPVSGLHASASVTGTRILWTPVNSPAAAISLQRSTVARASQPQTTPGSPSPGASAKSLSAPAKKSAATPEIVHLQAAPQGPDPGGTLDLSSQRGATYAYVAWRTRSAIVNGKPITLRSIDSPPLSLTVHDLTPPATPVGLDAVVDGASVDLSWEPDTEADLAGYWVERRQSPACPAAPGLDQEGWQRLNPAPLTAPSFRDTPPPSRALYRYRVLAVDTTGNLSQPTTPATVSITVP